MVGCVEIADEQDVLLLGVEVLEEDGVDSALRPNLAVGLDTLDFAGNTEVIEREAIG